MLDFRSGREPENEVMQPALSRFSEGLLKLTVAVRLGGIFLRKLSMLFVVASTCFADVAQGAVQGRTLRATNMQEQPGTGQFTFIKLQANAIFNVNCRVQSSVINLDPWWLNVVLLATGQSGWVADWDSACNDAVTHCDSVPHC